MAVGLCCSKLAEEEEMGVLWRRVKRRWGGDGEGKVSIMSVGVYSSIEAESVTVVQSETLRMQSLVDGRGSRGGWKGT